MVLGLSLFASASWAGDFETDKLDNWHQWRGPLADGTAPKGDPPITWDAKTNIKWKAPLVGRGSATPIIWGDRVFVVTAVKTDRKVEPDKRPKADPALQDEDRSARRILSIHRPLLRPRTGKDVEEGRRRTGSARGPSSIALVRGRFSDDRRQAPLRLFRLVRHLLLRLRRQPEMVRNWAG